MKYLSRETKRLGVAEHTYVVGGAVRNWLLDKPIKDIDIVFDSIGAGRNRDSDWLADQLDRSIPAQTNVTTNQYGVAILTVKGSWDLDGHDMKGEVIEIANARKESYGGAGGKGYKPSEVEPATIKEDLFRREFSFNTLLWRLLDLEHGPDRAEILDMTGRGRKDLEERLLTTPVNPDKTFGDDPTRMLRAIKFVAKYGSKIPPEIAASIRRNAPKLKQMPWDAVRSILVGDILDGPAPRASVKLLIKLGLDEVIKEMLSDNPGFATALSRSLSQKETNLLLDLLDLEWAIKTPVSFLDRASQKRLREILFSHSDDPAFEKQFMAVLKKPSINQMELFTEFNIPKNERGSVIQITRSLLLDDPALAGNARKLEDEVGKVLAQRFKHASMAERVVTRYVGKHGST